jgi:hypothetical protein
VIKNKRKGKDYQPNDLDQGFLLLSSSLFFLFFFCPLSTGIKPKAIFCSEVACGNLDHCDILKSKLVVLLFQACMLCHDKVLLMFQTEA